MAFRVRKVFGTLQKRVPGTKLESTLQRKEDKIENFVVKCSRRPHKCKTRHFILSSKGRERL